MKKIAVFCGSSAGNKDIYMRAAQKLADVLISHNIALVYGGSRVGLMGVLADRMLQQKGRVTGIMPGFLIDKEVAHNRLSKLIKVNTMHQRKALIQEQADGFIALPGGFGTMEEIFEMITWGQLKLHQKPCAFLNTHGYFDAIRSFLDKAVAEDFINRKYMDMIIIDNDPQKIIAGFFNYRHPQIDKLTPEPGI